MVPPCESILQGFYFLPDVRTKWKPSPPAGKTLVCVPIDPLFSASATRAFRKPLHTITFRACATRDCTHCDTILQRTIETHYGCKFHQWHWPEPPMSGWPLFDPWGHGPGMATTRTEQRYQQRYKSSVSGVTIRILRTAGTVLYVKAGSTERRVVYLTIMAICREFCIFNAYLDVESFP
jgi:hypothetical protein